MAKKGKKKKGQRSARDIQTPVSDRDNTADHLSDEPGSSRAQQRRQSHRNWIRSPTRKEDFAPGELGEDYESNDETDEDFDKQSLQDGPVEDKPDRVGRWVADVIQKEAQNDSANSIQALFTSEEPKYEECELFFEKLNERIRATNEAHDVVNIDNGTIPPRYYVDLCRTWQMQWRDAKENGRRDDAWDAFNKTYNLLKLFNKRHHLPKSWNLSSAWAEQLIGTRNPVIHTDSDSANENDNSESDDPINRHSEGEESNFESQAEESGNNLTGLDALEDRTQKEQRRLTSAKVLYWWPKGTGSQIFVRYGDRSAPIYRIRAGSHEYYNQSKVERVLTTKTRGTAKFTEQINGMTEEFWKYNRKHVTDILGVGWKIEDDDESATNALSLIRPEPGAVYPQTRILVQWRDGAITLEGRSFIRRITTGSALDGDRVIYQRARELESMFREKHGVDDAEEYDSDETFSEEGTFATPPHSPKRHKGRIRFEDESSEGSDVGRRKFGQEPSGSSRHPVTSLPRRARRESSQREHTSSRDGKIRMLEHQLEKLKVGDQRALRRSRKPTYNNPSSSHDFEVPARGNLRRKRNNRGENRISGIS